MKTSNYQQDANDARQRLDSVSPSFCLAKWNQVSLHLTTGLTNSCYHPPLHPIDPRAIAQNPARLHNTDQKLAERQEMLEGKRPPGCSYCWKIEDAGGVSDRIYRSGEPWAIQDFESIVGKPIDSEWTPRYVEVNFNHACNFKCSYCSPQFSTTWAQEIDRYGQYPTSPAHNAPEHFQGHRKPIPHREDNPYVTAFWRWWPTLYKNLKHFRMTGGEPMMDHNTYQVLDYVIDHPKKDLHLNVTSNMCPPDAKLKNKYFDKVKRICLDEHVEHFMQFVSLDAMFERAEYRRHGMNFERVWENVNRFLAEVPNRSSLTFIITMNTLNVTGLHELINGIHGLRQVYSKTYQRVWFDTPILRQPAWQNVQIMPEEYVDPLEETWAFMCSKMEQPENPYKGFKDYELHRLQRVIDYMQEGCKLDPEYVKMQRANFYRFFNEHDQRRGTDFVATFPEMKEFWNTCKYHAK